MRKIASLFVALVVATLITQPARAEGALILTDVQIFGIQENCLNSKAALTRLHTADTLLRVNLGQRYENISQRLMAPLNSRIALNGMDGIELTKLAVEYNQTIKQFTSQYSKYDAAVSDALDTDCVEDPVAYYQKIEQTRADRARVHETTKQINQLLSKYKAAFEAFVESEVKA
jgi:hypothetical protein